MFITRSVDLGWFYRGGEAGDFRDIGHPDQVSRLIIVYLTNILFLRCLPLKLLEDFRASLGCHALNSPSFRPESL